MFKTRTLDDLLSLASQFISIYDSFVLGNMSPPKKSNVLLVVRYADLKLYSSVAAGILRN